MPLTQEEADVIIQNFLDEKVLSKNIVFTRKLVDFLSRRNVFGNLVQEYYYHNDGKLAGIQIDFGNTHIHFVFDYYEDRIVYQDTNRWFIGTVSLTTQTVEEAASWMCQNFKFIEQTLISCNVVSTDNSWIKEGF